MTKQQKIKIKLPSSYGRQTRLAIAQEVIDQIVNRTQKEHVDKNGKKFPKYSKEYLSSPEFKAGGGGRQVDLTLSGDMLAALRLLNQKAGEITIGYKKGTENSKAEGNIIGSYGKPKGNRSKARNFLGISREELNTIKAKYPYRDKLKQKERVQLLGISDKVSKDITGSVAVARLEEEEES